MKMKVTELVCDAIKRLRDRNGSTTKDILNYITSEHEDTSPNVKKQVIAALQRGVDHGYLKRNRGHYTLSSAAFPIMDLDMMEQCGPKKRRRRRSKSRSMCGPKKRRRSKRAIPRKRRRRSKTASRRKRRSCSVLKPKRKGCGVPRRSKRMKCGPVSAKDSRSYNPDDKITKARTPVQIEEIFEHDAKPSIRRSSSKHPRRSVSKARESKRESRESSKDGEHSRSNNWSNHDD